MRSRVSLTVALLLVCAVSAAAAAAKYYVLVLKNGRKIAARSAPSYKNGSALYYAPNGTFTSVPEAQVDRAATDAANAPVAAPAPPKALGDAVAVKPDVAQQKLRRLERTAATVVGPAEPTAAAAGTRTGTSASDAKETAETRRQLEREKQANERAMDKAKEQQADDDQKKREEEAAEDARFRRM